MKDTDDNIQFDVMPDFGWGGTPKQQPVEKEYDTLYDELVDKCNPGNFKLEGLGKFNIANEIFARLQQMGTGISYETELRVLRNRAIDELGLHISTKKTFDRLQTFLDPDNYTGRQPYDKELVENAGRLFTQLMQNKDDIRALELIESLPMTAAIYEEYEYQKLSPEDYLEKYPEGKRVMDAKEAINQRLKRQMDEEREFFRTQSAYAYLVKYPRGLYRQEADCFINKGNRAYLKRYPHGRYANSAKSDKQFTGIAIGFGLMVLLIIVLAFAMGK